VRFVGNLSLVMNPDKNSGLIYKEECFAIIGACFEVYNEKGSGFTEPIYQECLEIELELREIQFQSQASLPLSYKQRPLRQRFQPDFVCMNNIILEIKAVSALADEHRSQVLNYLNATGFKLGLLVNFGHHGRLEWERIVK